MAEREEWLEKIIQKHGNFKWPSYPDKFDPNAIPKFIKDAWQWKRFYFDKEKSIFKIVPTLLMEQDITMPAEGDLFNAIVVKKRKAKDERGLYRILQFDMKGYVEYGKSLSRKQTLKEGQVKAGLVYRFEITEVRENDFYCVALAHTFNKDNLIENWIYCNYKESKRN